MLKIENVEVFGMEHNIPWMITVYMDITAPLYWWTEFEAYAYAVVTNGCSTMHKIAEKEFVLNDFSHEHLDGSAFDMMSQLIFQLNRDRERYLQTKDDEYRWQIRQLLPSSYNQRRTVKLTYDTMSNLYDSHNDHKRDEWCYFCKWIEEQSFGEFITNKERKNVET